MFSEDEVFIQDVPPPYCSGTLHHGHIFQYSLIDIINKYKIYKKVKVYRTIGFDVHGLPTILRVRNLYNTFKDSQDFRKKCDQFVENKKMEMLDTFNKFNINFDEIWATNDKQHAQLVQQFLTKAYDKKLLVVKEDVQEYCLGCKTTLSRSELGIKHTKTMEYLVTWICEDSGMQFNIMTKLPQLLWNTYSLACHPDDIRYKNYIGKKFTLKNIPHITTILRAEDTLDMDKGTGLVYFGAYGSKFDVDHFKKYNIQTKNYIENNLVCNMQYEEFSKKYINQLKDLGTIKEQGYSESHVLIHAERSSCKQPIHYIKSKHIFIACSQIRKQLTSLLNSIQVSPEKYNKDTFNWIDNLEDWCISRNYVYGTQLHPICRKLGIEIDENVVCDCWVDSAVTFYRLYKKYKVLPDVRIQGYEICRTWLIYTLIAAFILDCDLPFKYLILTNLLLGKNYKKLSKSNLQTVSLQQLSNNKSIKLWSCYLLADKDIVYDTSKLVYAQRMLHKLKNIKRYLQTIKIEDVKTNYKNIYNSFKEQMDVYQIQTIASTCDSLLKQSRTLNRGINTEEKQYLSNLLDILLYILC